MNIELLEQVRSQQQPVIIKTRQIEADHVAQVAADKRRQDQKQQERDLRRDGRLAPFIELTERNREIAMRARNIRNLPIQKPSHYLSPVIVLKKPDENATTSVVGYVKKHDTHDFRFYFNVFVADDREVEEIREFVAGKNMIEGLRKHANRKPDVLDYTFVASDNGPNSQSDEIYRTAEIMTTEGRFGLVSGLRRNLYQKRVDERLKRLTETIELFENAVADPELNPELAVLIG